MTQHESLLNSHHLRSNKILVDDVVKEEDGKQFITLKDHDGNRGVIPFEIQW